jgi:cytochrome c oxidase subunit II
MKARLAFSILLIACLCAITESTPKSSAQAADAGAVQLITVSAQRYHFDPAEIRVKQGTTVRLKITAMDHAHGFKINLTPDGEKGSEPGLVFSSPQECVRIEEGQTTTVEFVAKKAGTYQFHCCVVCGFHHRSMKGQLVVEP